MTAQRAASAGSVCCRSEQSQAHTASGGGLSAARGPSVPCRSPNVRPQAPSARLHIVPIEARAAALVGTAVPPTPGGSSVISHRPHPLPEHATIKALGSAATQDYRTIVRMGGLTRWQKACDPKSLKAVL